MTTRALGYREDAASLTPGVFALADPDPAPIEGPPRVATTWRGPVWFERDLGTGKVLARGVAIPPRAERPNGEETRP